MFLKANNALRSQSEGSYQTKLQLFMGSFLKKSFFRKKAFNGTLEEQCLHLNKANIQKKKTSLRSACYGYEDLVAAYNHFAHRDLLMHSAYTFTIPDTHIQNVSQGFRGIRTVFKMWTTPIRFSFLGWIKSVVS